MKDENKARKVVLCEGDKESFATALNGLIKSGYYVRYDTFTATSDGFACLLVEPKEEESARLAGVEKEAEK